MKNHAPPKDDPPTSTNDPTTPTGEDTGDYHSGESPRKPASGVDLSKPGEFLMTPTVKAATSLANMDPEHRESMIDIHLALKAQADEMEKGNLNHPLKTLAAQASTLDTLFYRALSLAFCQSRHDHHTEMLYRVALKAQAQSAKTLQAIVDLKKEGNRKNVLYAQQANIAGQQVVNNNSPAPQDGQGTPGDGCIVRSADSPKPEQENHAALDTRSPQEAIGGDPELEAVEQVHRPSDI